LTDVRCDQSNLNNIYISRQKSDFRSVSNFGKLEDYLSSNGFDICFFEEMNVSEQIVKISAADLIIAPHGAGLANLVWSSEKVVIELFGRKRKPTFYLLAKSLGYEYGFLLCDEDDRGLIVDVQKLRKLINKIQ
jgi:capsular polysaccharide biosynthesis protein